MKLAIVDDELIFAKSFSKTLKNVWTDTIESLDIFLSAENFLPVKGDYDIVFLDIEMPGLTGIELAQKHFKTESNIVFVTNRDDLVFEAYNTTEAIGFIRKSNLDKDLNYIIRRINYLHQQTACVSVKTGDTITKLRYSDIIFIEKVSHNVVIHTATHTYSRRTAISDIESELSNFGFVRTHVGFLANLSYIELIKSNYALLSNGDRIPISRSNLKQVKEKFLERNVLLNE